jgi:NitT/TauT family transport system substrate-binding protein
MKAYNIKNRVTGALTVCALVILGSGLSYADALKKVTLRTDYKVNGYVGAFLLARDRGFYRDAGLDVEIGEGQGSSTTVQTVAAGGDTFGLADATALVVGVSARSIPLKAIAVYSQTGVQGFAYHKESGWDGKAASMKGKVVISSPGSAELSLLPAIFSTAGFKVSDVELRLADPSAKIPLFIQTPDSFIGGYTTGDAVRIRSKMPDVGFIPFSEFGINTYGTALIASTSTIQDEPDLVRRFVAASLKGWEATVKDPEAAIQAAMKQFPESNVAFLREGLKIMIDQQLHTPATAAKPIGWMAESDWIAMLNLLHTYANVKIKEPSAYYTNEFNGL